MQRWVWAVSASLILGSTAMAQHMRELVSNTEIHFFADVNAEKFAGVLEAPSTLRLGNLDFYIYSHLGQFAALTEFAYEPTPTDYGLDVERLQITWSPASYFRITVGRYHTPLGYWNINYHHGRWMFTTADSPLLFRFEDEGGPLPAHTVGALFFGDVSLTNTVSLRYDFGVGNGRGPKSDPPVKLQSFHEKKSLLGGLHLSAGGFRTGAAVYLDFPEPFSLNSAGDPPQLRPNSHLSMKEQIVVGDVTYTTSPWELLLEGALIRHDYANQVVNHYAGYAQIAYQVTEQWKPYARGEIQHIQRNGPYFVPVLRLGEGMDSGGFSPIPSLNRVLAGFRFDPVEMLAVKLEGGVAWQNGGSPGEFGRLQLAFVF